MANGKKTESSADYTPLRSDRRKNLRSQLLVLNVRIESNNKSFFGYAKVLGRSGMFITSVNPKKVGEEFFIEFTLPDKTVARCKCCIVWRREFVPRSPHEPGMGIKFIDLSEDIRNRIDEWVKKG